MNEKEIDPNKKHYFSELEPQAFDKIIEKVIEKKVSIKLWEQGKGQDEVETYQPIEGNSLKRKLILTPNKGLLSPFFKSKLLGKNVFVKIGGDKFLFFSTGILKESPHKKYSLTLNKRLFKGQQRSNYRLSACRQVRIQFRLDEETLHECLDVSAGGVSFIIPNSLLNKYPQSRVFKKCRLAINTFTLDIPNAKVVGQWPFHSSSRGEKKETKIGLSFSKIPRDDEEKLFRTINFEARTEEMRKKLLKGTD